jgi:hydroxymethylbilane synthase
LHAALWPLVDVPTWIRVSAERAVSRARGGSCSMPLAAHAVLTGDVLQVRAAWGDPEGQPVLVQAQAQATLALPGAGAAPWGNLTDQAALQPLLAQAAALGDAVATQLRAGGAR